MRHLSFVGSSNMISSKVTCLLTGFANLIGRADIGFANLYTGLTNFAEAVRVLAVFILKVFKEIKSQDLIESIDTMSEVLLVYGTINYNYEAVVLKFVVRQVQWSATLESRTVFEGDWASEEDRAQFDRFVPINMMVDKVEVNYEF